MQRPQAVDDAAIGEHDLETEHLLPRIAVTDDVDPAGVGRQVAADLAAPFRTEAQRKIAIDGAGLFLQRGQDTACLRDHRKVLRVDRANPVEPRQRQDQLLAGLVRYCATTEPRVAALRNDGDVGARAQPDHLRDLRGCPR